jgi:hypothetical protein
MSAGRGHICPTRRKSRSLRSVITNCLRQDASIALLEEILRSGAAQGTSTPSLNYRRDPFVKDNSINCERPRRHVSRKQHRSVQDHRVLLAR